MKKIVLLVLCVVVLVACKNKSQPVVEADTSNQLSCTGQEVEYAILDQFSFMFNTLTSDETERAALTEALKKSLSVTCVTPKFSTSILEMPVFIELNGYL